ARNPIGGSRQLSTLCPRLGVVTRLKGCKVCPKEDLTRESKDGRVVDFDRPDSEVCTFRPVRSGDLTIGWVVWPYSSRLANRGHNGRFRLLGHTEERAD